ncbi:class I SAM-dependent methyltransferase [Nitratireductor sp. L1-7-SE]|uniref:Class I SAM-dependent methyltransferase n=2 Tax=Nitratireductor rhodophyticola TaxID=2854036 RepID=A0ABS7R983_9HYPH|nr:class I SAM-dependent methyltransferase [Nitratireductor rhodophyticola]MBY8917491.1 class I SAM-dependent methyltransferase [Nitratireductor rhodophyticola]MBY8922202.1 class I SAM-dependent methyltransferase [Nitratireductor rhodophyticola]
MADRKDGAMENAYGTLASWVYHLDKPIGRSFGDIEFYRDRLAGCTGPVLEPAAGNGRVLIPLLEAGFDIRGFDASEEMVAYCRSECEARGLPSPVDIARFESFNYETRFGAIIIPAGSFQLITEPGQALAVLERFRGALEPGGRLILDLDALACLAETALAARHWQAGDDLLTLVESRVETCFQRQTTLSQLRYEHWREGRLVASEIQLFHLRLWGLLEFELALRSAGFTEVGVYADYRTDSALEPGASIFTFEAVAPL